MQVLQTTALQSLAGRSVVAPCTAARRSVVAHAENPDRKPSWKLDTPNRLWEGAETWFPEAEAPEYLDGTLPGDRGFDPLRLAKDPNVRAWLVEGELYNGRVAMMAAAGVLLVEYSGLGPWYEAPFKIQLPLPYQILVVLGHAIFGAFEYKRFTNFQKYGETGLLNLAPFDPLGLRSDRNRQAEVRNGRLAMVANLGFWTQAAVTKKTLVQNIDDHLADPGHNNICESSVGPIAVGACVLIGVLPFLTDVFTGQKKNDYEGRYPALPFDG